MPTDMGSREAALLALEEVSRSAFLGGGGTDEGESRIGPRLHAALKHRHVRKALRRESRRLTGGGSLLGSGSVEDDLAILGEGRQLRLKL